jgi:hypothetical protein
VHTYGDYEGDVFEYKACQTSEDDKKWMKTDSNRKMNLKEWNTVSEKYWSNRSEFLVVPKRAIEAY